MGPVFYTNTQQRQLRRIVPDLIRARELLFELIWKDLRVRYRYAVLGFLWAIFEPVALMLILTFVFTLVLQSKIQLPQEENAPPFAVMLLCGLIFWQFFSTAVTSASNSIMENQSLVKKVYFAREVVPLAAVGYPLFNLTIGFLVLLVVHMVLGGALSLALVWIPVIFLIQLALTVGLALLVSAANVRFRDIGYMVSVFMVLGFYGSPIFYRLEHVMGAELLPPWAARLYLLNPMAELLTAYRQVLFEHRFPDLWLLGWPCGAALIVLVAGLVVFRYNAPTLSDYL